LKRSGSLPSTYIARPNGPEHLRSYQIFLLQPKKLEPSTVEIRISALRFLYKRTLRRRDFTCDDLIFPKVPEKLPIVLSRRTALARTALLRGSTPLTLHRSRLSTAMLARFPARPFLLRLQMEHSLQAARLPPLRLNLTFPPEGAQSCETIFTEVKTHFADLRHNLCVAYRATWIGTIN
jgi:hypothetical protein